MSSLGKMPIRSRSAVASGGIGAAAGTGGAAGGAAAGGGQTLPVDQRRADEANKLFESAEEQCGTTWYRWTPNWEEAALRFDRAGTEFAAARAYRQAAQAYKRASEASLQSHNPGLAARYLEKSAETLATQPRQFQSQAVDEYAEAARIYAEAGSAQRGAMVMLTGARLARAIDPPKSVKMYLAAIELLALDSREKLGSEAFSEAVQVAVAANILTDAITVLEKQIEVGTRTGQSLPCCRGILGLIVVHLAQVDMVAADRTYHKYLSTPGFTSSPEARTAAELLEAAERASLERFQKVISSTTISFLDSELYRLAQRIPIREFTPTQPQTLQEFVSSQPIQPVSPFPPSASKPADTSSLFSLSSPATSSSSSQPTPTFPSSIIHPHPSSSSSTSSSSTSSTSTSSSSSSSSSKFDVPKIDEDSPPSSPDSVHKRLLDPHFDPETSSPFADGPVLPPSSPAAHFSDDEPGDDPRLFQPLDLPPQPPVVLEPASAATAIFLPPSIGNLDDWS